MDTDDRKLEYHEKLKILAQKGCIIFSPHESHGYWEIGMRDPDGNYLRISREKALRDTIDCAIMRTNEQKAYFWKKWNTDDGRALILIVLFSGLIYGMVSFFLSAMNFLGR